MKRKLIIHIGAHKTGSTAIQKFFFNFSKNFESFGLLYPVENQVEPEFGFWGHHYLTWYFTPPHIKLDKNKLILAFKNFMEIISKNTSKNILISSEDFIWNKKIQEFINYVKDYFHEIMIIMYVRRQVDAALSLYQTGVVNGGYTIRFQDWFKKAAHLFDYYAIANQWKELECKVIVKPFILKKFENRDVILDFLKTLSQILGKEISPPMDYKPKSIKVNISLPDFITMMIIYYNSRPSKDKVIPILKELGLKLREIIPDIPKYDFVPPSVKKEIVNLYKDSNRLLCEKYLGLEYLDWLNKDIDESDEQYIERFGYEGSQLVELCKAVIRILEKIYNK